jgi:hypothetical protein
MQGEIVRLDRSDEVGRVLQDIAPTGRVRDFAAAARYLGDKAAISPHALLDIDRTLRRRKVRTSLPIREEFWKRSLAARPDDIGLLAAVLEAALEARSHGIQWDISARLAAALEIRPAEATARAWCLVAEARHIAPGNQAVAEALANAAANDPNEIRVLALQAALAIRERDPALAGILDRLARRLDAAGNAESAAMIDGYWAGRSSQGPADRLEIIVFSHVTRKLKKFAHLGAPSTGLVETALGSFRNYVSPPVEARVRVLFDHNGTELDDIYQANLAAWCAQHGASLETASRNGLRRQWLAALARTDTDIVGIIEQDHEFLPGAPAYAAVKRIFDENADINYVRLNRRTNKSWGLDRFLFQFPGDRAYPFCRTVYFSNTPHFLRRTYYENFIRPLIQSPRMDGGNSGAAGVEENINDRLMALEEVVGLPLVLAVTGMAIWGNQGAAPVAGHRGE